MRIKDGFVLREVAGNYVVIALGEDALDFNSVITLNEIGALIWNGLLEENNKEQIIKKILSEYAIDEETATGDFNEFVGQLRELNIIED